MLLIQDLFIAIYLALTAFINILVPLSGSITVTSVLAIFTNPQKALGMAAFFFFIGGIFRIYLFRKEIVWEEIKMLLPISIIAALFGIYLSLMINSFYLLILILIFAIYFFFKKIKKIVSKKNPPKKKQKIMGFIVGLFSGFLQGSGLGGSDLRNSYLLGRNLKLIQLQGTTALIGSSTFLLSFVIRLYKEAIVFSDIYFLIFLIPLQFTAIFYGKKVLHKLNDKTSNFLILTIMLLIISGLVIKLIFFI